MAAVRGGRGKGLAAQGDEVVLTHKPLNPLGIYNHAGASEHGRDAPVAIEPVAQAEQLDVGCQLHIGFTRGMGLEAAIVARPGNACEFAQVLHINLAGFRCSHGFDDLRDAGTIEPWASGPFKARKAL